jgi:hypothetical protein
MRDSPSRATTRSATADARKEIFVGSASSECSFNLAATMLRHIGFASEWRTACARLRPRVADIGAGARPFRPNLLILRQPHGTIHE